MHPYSLKNNDHQCLCTLVGHHQDPCVHDEIMIFLVFYDNAFIFVVIEGLTLTIEKNTKNVRLSGSHLDSSTSLAGNKNRNETHYQSSRKSKG